MKVAYKGDFSVDELQIVSDLDRLFSINCLLVEIHISLYYSKQFGSINNDSSDNILLDLVRRAVSVLQTIVLLFDGDSYGKHIKEHNTNLKECTSFSSNTGYQKSFRGSDNPDPYTFCKLGHLHLLLGEFDEGMIYLILRDSIFKCFFFSSIGISTILQART